MGAGNLAAEAELIGCFGAFTTSGYDPTFCPWFVTPPTPGTARAARWRSTQHAAWERLARPGPIRSQICALYAEHRTAACAG
jgi:hypothetical protein